MPVIGTYIDNRPIILSVWLEDGSGFGGNASNDFFAGGSGVGCGTDSVHDGSSILYLPRPVDDIVSDPLIVEALRCL